jgi:hypothetical protein
VGVTTALGGAGGFGKSALAAWVCHRPEVTAAFPDGVLWITLGEDLACSRAADGQRSTPEATGQLDEHMPPGACVVELL